MHKIRTSFIFLVLFVSLISFTSALTTTGTIDWESYLKVINDNPYGFGVDNVFGYSSNTVTSNLNCTKNNRSDAVEVRQEFLNAGGKVARYDIRLDNMYNSSGSLLYTSELRNITDWAYNNNVKLELIANYAPTSNRNTTASCTSTPTTCPPTNYTLFAEQLARAINNVTNNNATISVIKGISIWNEAFNSASFMSDLGFDNETRFAKYKEFYNTTYIKFKQMYPNIPVTHSMMEGGSKVPKSYNWSLGNFSSQMDYVSLHIYQGLAGLDNFTAVSDELNFLDSMCDAYGVTCVNVTIGEWNIIGSSPQTVRSASLSAGYSSMLNDQRFDITSILFKFTTAYQNASCESYYNYTAYQQFNNTKFDGFNITDLFSSIHAIGNKVVTSSMSAPTVKIVASYDSTGKKYITITNTNATAFNVTLSGLNENYEDVETNTEYYVDVNGEITFYNIPSYDVFTLSSTDSVDLNILNICNESDLTFVEASALAGIILTILFVVTIIGVLILGFAGIIDIDNVISNMKDFSTEQLVSSVLIIGLVFMTLITMAFLIGGSVCPAYQ